MFIFVCSLLKGSRLAGPFSRPKGISKESVIEPQESDLSGVFHAIFSSPKGIFKALLYKHRYRTETVGTVLNDYLPELFAGKEMDEDALRVLRDDLKRYTAIQIEIEAEVPLVREATRWSKPMEALTQ